MANIDLQEAIEPANPFWAGPCQDKAVWIQFAPIRIADEERHFGLTPDAWEPLFVNYISVLDHAGHQILREGLYFLPIEQADWDYYVKDTQE
jgi:hypothetical protein